MPVNTQLIGQACNNIIRKAFTQFASPSPSFYGLHSPFYFGLIFRQHAASIYGFVRKSVTFVENFFVSVRWVTVWVRPPPLKICVSVRWVTLWVRPPLVCVLSLDPCMLPTPLCGNFFIRV